LPMIVINLKKSGAYENVYPDISLPIHI